MNYARAFLAVVAAGFLACALEPRGGAEAAKAAPAQMQAPDSRPRKIYAHYMGCWPVASGALLYSKLEDDPKMRHDSASETIRHGGHVRNWDLTPWGMKLSPEESADLEIRRALRIGIDGFAVDAWAGQDDARHTLDALFKVAEDKGYPFEVTVCIDPTCGGKIVDTVKYLLEKHGSSPKLARRDGKPLIFGYQSVWCSSDYLARKFAGRPSSDLSLLRATPEGWDAMGEAYEDAARQIGRPIYWYYCLSAFFYGVDNKLAPKGALVRAASAIARHVQAVGAFSGLGDDEPEIARAVKAAGAEWSTPLGMFQKENVPYELYAGKGLDWMCANWARVRDQDSRLLQLVTWNDYGENTNLAPGYNTRYTLYDLTGYFIQWWKNGKPPLPDHDRVYLLSRKYPPGVKVFPFKQGPYAEGALEVVTILPKPALVRLPGRAPDGYSAPAGFFRKQFPVTPGPVVAELVRDGKVTLRIESPEPVTDRPFREDNGMVGYSTEFNRHWKADFGDAKPFLWSEYGDVNNNGLPNWFEMYWFGKFGDMSTAACADPNADPDGDGRTNLQEYLDQTDPTQPPIPYTAIPTNGLLAWYRADKGVVADEKGLVSEWQDQSGNQLHLSARTEAEKPRLVAKAWNDLPALELDGSRNSLSCLLPEKTGDSMTVVAVFAARAADQICRIQEGANNRLVSIPTLRKADWEGGIAIGVSSIDRPWGDVAVTRREFGAGDRPMAIGLGYMCISGQPDYRNWNFKGKVAEILVYVPALNEAETQKVVSILRTRYRL